MAKYVPIASSDTGKMRTLSEELVLKSKGALICPKEVMDRINVLGPEAVNTLEHLMLNSRADSVRLKAALEVLALGGITKDHKITIKTEVEDLDDQGLNTRLQDLLGRAHGVVIEGESTDVTPKDLH